MSEEDKLGILAGVTFVLSPEQYTKYKKSLNEQINDLQEQRDKQKEVLDKIKEKINQYEFISGYYDDNYDGEDTTYSHDTLKEEILELLEEIE